MRRRKLLALLASTAVAACLPGSVDIPKASKVALDEIRWRQIGTWHAVFRYTDEGLVEVVDVVTGNAGPSGG